MSKRLYDLELFEEYVRKHNLASTTKITDIELSFEELVKVYYPNINLYESFCLYSLNTTGMEYPVLTVYLTYDNKWIFQFAYMPYGGNHKFIFVEYDEFPTKILNYFPIYKLLEGKQFLEVIVPKLELSHYSKIPYKYWVMDYRYEPLYELNGDCFDMPLIKTKLDDDLNWTFNYYDQETVLEMLKNYKISE